MADFYTVLMNSLRKRDIADPAARERVYLRARMALIRKLWGQRPRMTDREIEDEVSIFDLAVGLVESDVAASLPVPKRERLRREKVSQLVREHVPEIHFDITEFEVDAEAEPEEEDQLAYHAHLQEAAARVNQWTEAMVHRIDPVAVAKRALAGGGGGQGFRRVAVAGPAGHETVLAEPIINMALERTMPEPGRRRFRSFFPRRGERPVAVPVDPDSGEYGRMEQFARAVTAFFEQLSFRLYEGSVAEHRRRRGQLAPRVNIRSPLQIGSGEFMQRRQRRRLIVQAATPVAIIAVLGVLGWLGARYQTEITAKVEELVTDARPIQEIAAPAAPVAIELKGGEADTAEPDIVLFDGRDPSVFQAGGEKPVVFGNDAAGGYVRIHASGAARNGARLLISSGVADRLARRTVHFVVTARAPVEDGAGTIRLGYHAGDEAGPSATQPLGREYRRLEIVWTVPGGSGLGQHALFIEPGLLGGGSTIDVKSVELFLEARP